MLHPRYQYHEHGATSQLSWTTTTWTSLKHYVCSKRPCHRGLPFRHRSNVTSPQHLSLKSPTRERIRFKLVTKTRLLGTYRPPWATSTAGASSDSPSTAGATQQGNRVMQRARDRRGRGRHCQSSPSRRSPFGLSDYWNLLASVAWMTYSPKTRPTKFSPSGRPCRRQKGWTYSVQRPQDWPRLARPEGSCDLGPYLCDGRGLD